MLEQISWSYSFSSNNWWKLAIIAIVLKIVSGLMYAWLDDTNSIAYGITAIVGYVMYLFIGVLAAIMFAIMVVGNHPDGKPTNMNNIPNLTITVENNIVTIEPLPDRFRYTKLDDSHRLNAEARQKFKYEVNKDFGTGYLISEDGGKFKLSDEDKEYLKERGVR